MSGDREARVRAFHARRPGCTSSAYRRGGSYERLARRVPAEARVLDLACGDGELLARLGANRVGLDLSAQELAHARGRGCTSIVHGRAQALPFAAGRFEACVCHLAFMLFADVDRVVAELARVLAPGGRFLALLGGGPVAIGPDERGDAFHRFLQLVTAPAAAAPLVAPVVGDVRATTERGWRELFAGWEVEPFERWELDLGGSFDEVWDLLGSSYELAPAHAERIRGELERATIELAEDDGRIPCRVVTWLACATKPG